MVHLTLAIRINRGSCRSKDRVVRALACLLVGMAVAACSGSAATPTATAGHTATASPALTPTIAPTPTPTIASTATHTPTPTTKPTAAPPPTPTAKPTTAPTPKPTAAPTATPTAVHTPSLVPGPAHGFALTGSMSHERTCHSAVLVGGKEVLIVGGAGLASGNALKTAELYSPSTGTFRATGSMSIARCYAFAVTLKSGHVLVGGGTDNGVMSKVAELYDYATGTFTPTGSLVEARADAKATLLANGTVLIAGGMNATGKSLASAEIYDPGTGLFTATGPMAHARDGFTATRLRNGRVLVVGGGDNTVSPPVLTASAELYNPTTGTFSATGSLPSVLQMQTATLLGNGDVLIAAGDDWAVNPVAYLYNPTTHTFSATGALHTGQVDATASILADGRVLVIGGYNNAAPNSHEVRSAEIYDWHTGAWTSAGNMVEARYDATATLLPNGNVLVAGGACTSAQICASAELFRP